MTSGYSSVLPAPGEREREHLAGVLVRRDDHAGLELGPDHPEPGLDVDLEELEVGAVAEVDERQLTLATVERLGDLECRHAPMKPRSCVPGHERTGLARAWPDRRCGARSPT